MLNRKNPQDTFQSIWSVFVRKPVATSLITLALALPGLVCFNLLPISALPMVDLPTIGVEASLPGAAPEIVASALATPLERALGRISGVTELTSTSSQGQTRISVQFDLDKDINGAAREVQAAINAANADLPSGMISKPSYRKSNASGAPIMIVALTSTTITQERLYDLAFSRLGQAISQVTGVGDVAVNGSSLRAIRVELDPNALNQRGISLEQVRSAIASANPNRPTGVIEGSQQRWQVAVNDQVREAADLRNLIIHESNGQTVRLSDVARVEDSVQERRNAGTSGGVPAVLLVIFGEPGANVVATADSVKALLPGLQKTLPAAVDMEVVIDRTGTVRKSLEDIEHTLLIALALVVLVTYLFLRDLRATLIPMIAIPVTLSATLVVIYLCGFSLNNLSLMAVIIATSFVVDDAIVMVENASHHIQKGLTPMAAAVQSLREQGFTLLAMNLALVAVFTPLIFMGGALGRLFREFSVTLAAAVFISLLVTLISTPMLCARLLKPRTSEGLPAANPLSAISLRTLYARSLHACLSHKPWVLVAFAASIGLSLQLYQMIPKGFFPQQDTGRLNGQIQTEQSISFTEARRRIVQLMDIVGQDPAIDSYYEFTGGRGGGTANTGSFYARLKPMEERGVSAQAVANRLRAKLNQVPGANLFVSPPQDLNFGARISSGAYQYSLLADDVDQLRLWAPRVRTALSKLPELTDLNTDYQDRGLQLYLNIDKDAAARLGVSTSQIDAALNTAFGQRVVTTLYEPLNQYFVVVNLAQAFTQTPQALEQIYVPDAQQQLIPLASFARWETRNTPLSINHQEQFAAVTLSFNLAANVSLDQATSAIEHAFNNLQPPANLTARFAGTAKVFQQSLASQPWLIMCALLAVYLVLGMLYESTLHPLTILSSLPAAGFGALIALKITGTEFTLIALIGIILVIGIVLKNAIIMINCALQLEQRENLASDKAIYQACLLRLRPILMTSVAAILGALPLALGTGDGAEIRQPLGITIVGGLIVGQCLTLYTTPVIYLYLQTLRRRLAGVSYAPSLGKEA
ncbi:MAG TPA: efflux RND transporter permease subunit [Cellvibrionaceae bacterium]